MIAKQDTLKMQFVIQNQLVPMMIRNGFDLAGCTFKYDDSETMPLAEQAKIDASFMPYVKFEHEYLEHKYGIELMDEEMEVETVANKLKNLYK
jgi:predicted transcriptional regulator